MSQGLIVRDFNTLHTWTIVLHIFEYKVTEI